jgi:hypothetical protein
VKGVKEMLTASELQDKVTQQPPHLMASCQAALSWNRKLPTWEL